MRRRRRRLPFPLSHDGRADRLTLGLAAVAVGTAGSVMTREFLRLGRRRSRSEIEGPLPTPGQALGTAGRATQDVVAVARKGYEVASRPETVLFNLLTGFVFSFALVRISTVGIRSGWWPFGNVRVGGRHIHHFVPGILISFATGAVALLTDNPKLEERLAVPFGAGIGLTFDESALLLDLRDVYWTREGVLSVQLSCGVSAILGGTLIALRMLRRGEVEAVEQGLVPTAAGPDQPLRNP